MTKTHEGALLPRVFWSNFREGFLITVFNMWVKSEVFENHYSP